MTPVRIGLVGCGEISGLYLQHLTGMLSPFVDVVACSDLIEERARNRAQEFGVKTVCTTDELLAHPEVELVVNLTMPAQHHEVSLAALAAGKHVFSEKPLAVSRPLGQQIMQTAAGRNLQVGGAADTFLGAALQACRRLIDEGAIGTPISAQAFLGFGPGSERYYNVFTGPLFDMGPYYLTALVSLLGPVVRLTGTAQIPFAERAYPADSPDAGQTFRITRPGNISALLDFVNGGVGVLTTTCEVAGHHIRLEIYGSEATLIGNDPNCYTGSVKLWPRKGEPQEVPLAPGFPQRGRGLGVAEMAQALREGRAPRASGALMYHVLDIMHAIPEAADQGRHVTLDSACPRPAPLIWEQFLPSAR